MQEEIEPPRGAVQPPARPSPGAATWWSRPLGGREVLQVALPLVVSALSWTVMTFVDRMFLKWQSGTAMSAAFSASAVWFAVLCLPLGICAYANTFVSQYFGSGQNHRVGPSVWQGVWAALLQSPVVLLAIPVAPAIFSLADHGSESFALETQYFQILCWGGPALLIAQALAAFYSGRGKTGVVMRIDATFAVVNLVLDYLWIFGHGGFAEMGIVGAGWATVTSLWLKAATYAYCVLQPVNRERFNTWSGMRLDRPLLGRLIYYGGPSGMQMLLDVFGFTAFILLVGRIGSIQAEATTMVFSVSTLAFMPIWGLGMAVGVLVGQQLGKDRPDLAERATWTALLLGLAYMVAMSGVYIALPDMFLAGFFAQSEATPEQASVRDLAVRLLWFVAAYNLFDAALMVFVNAIKGAGDTRFVLGASCVMAALLAICSWLFVVQFQVGIYGCWALITGWIWVLGIVFLLRFLQGRWKDMRVIEEDDVPMPETVAAQPTTSPTTSP